jgi:two-component system cell cycle sensor histidine kinase/response regulator CckA
MINDDPALIPQSPPPADGIFPRKWDPLMFLSVVMVVGAGGYLISGVLMGWSGGSPMAGRLVMAVVGIALAMFCLYREITHRRLVTQLCQLREAGHRAHLRSQAATERLMSEIAEHRRTLDRLRTSERNYRNVFENTGTATIILSPDMTITRLNAKFTELTGFTRGEIEHRKRLADFVTPEAEGMLSDYFHARNVGEKRPAEIEFELNDRSGNAKQVVVQVGDIPGTHTFVASLLDVTDRIEGERERHELEAQLHHAQRMEAIGTLAGGIAHDFNNLMMGMLGNLSLVMAKLEDGHPGVDKLKNVETLIHSGAKLTGQLLGYARKGNYEIHRIDINAVVKKTAETIGRTMKGVSIELSLGADIEGVCADPGQMEQVLVNLMVNAADAMPSGGTLTLATDPVTHLDFAGRQFVPKPGAYTRLTVRDTGIGMDAQTLSRIFDPFFTTKEMGRGTGLGLASVYGIVKGHGGYIDAASVPGEGTTFSIFLPVAGPLPGSAPAVDCQWSGGNETILVVDDEPMVNEVTTGMLTAAGYRVISAQNGNEALDLYHERAGDIDMILMDMVMPGLSGEALLARLQQIDPAVAVLISSGYAMDSKSEKLLHNGARGFIQKPFDMGTLSKRIREVLDGSRIAA